MAYDWKDKIVLITGAGKGIGSHIVRIIVGEGAKHVAILDVDEENSVALQVELNGKYGADKVKFYKCDVTNEEQLVGLFENILGDKTNEYVVINNAGILNDSLRTYKKQIEINVIALVTGSLKALELMRKDQGGKGGAIINMSSIAALCPLPYTPIYNATKSAVLVFSSGLGTDEYYARTGVRVLTMCFGATDTGLLALENMGNFDNYIASKLVEPLQIYPSQKVESAAQSVVDAYKQGKSGSVWLSNANRPAEEITDTITEAFGIMSAPIFKKD